VCESECMRKRERERERARACRERERARVWRDECEHGVTVEGVVGGWLLEVVAGRLLLEEQEPTKRKSVCKKNTQ
jgi:hypothetical protein